jgi:hypothetical protein
MGPARNSGGTGGHGYRGQPRGIDDSVLLAGLVRQCRRGGGVGPPGVGIEVVSEKEFRRRRGVLGWGFQPVQQHCQRGNVYSPID